MQLSVKGLRAGIAALGIICFAAIAGQAAPGGSILDNAKGILRTKQEDSQQAVSRDLPFYVGSMDASFDLPVWFVNGVEDVPYLELGDLADLLVTLYQSYIGDEAYELSVEKDGPTVCLERENGYHAVFDFEKGTITFNDYDGFLHDSSDSSLLDSVSGSVGQSGENELFHRLEKGSYDRYGSEITLDLAGYGISMYHGGNGYYVPLQTMGDFFFSLPASLNTLFNGKAVILGTETEIGNPWDGYTDLGEYYYSVEPSLRSEELARYSYNELCLALDCLYGQKEIHEIGSFDTFFEETGYKEPLLHEEPLIADLALEEFINYYLDDLHSGFSGYSCMSGAYETEENLGLANTRFDELYYLYDELRSAVMGEEIPPYEEVGNTAYVTFDSFDCNDPSAYYEYLEGIDIGSDTIALAIYAHEQINREDSPIENVVIDLSCNTGGAVDAAAFLIAWCLGDADLTVKDTFTGALSTSIYEADTNLDNEYDLTDSIFLKNLYCLISPVSFSCGNLVPSAFKSSHMVTLLGRTTGGGSCMVLPMSTAYGSLFQISAPMRMSSYKNGSSYDIDRGIDPDYTINNIVNYYDREALTDYINGLF